MPARSFNSLGWRRTGRVRVRTVWIFAILEEEIERYDGERSWQRAAGYRILD